MTIPKMFLFGVGSKGNPPVPERILPDIVNTPKETGDRLFAMAEEIDDISDSLPTMRKDLRSVSYLIRSIVIGHPYIS